MKRKIIKIISLIVIILLVFEIYIYANPNKVYYVALGDFLTEGINPYGEKDYGYSDYLKDYFKSKNKLAYYKNYANSTDTTNDLIEDIKYKTEIKKDLRESDIVTLSIGINNLLNQLGNDIDINEIPEIKEKVKEILPDISKTLTEIRKYAMNKIIIVGYYNPVPFLFNTSTPELDSLFAYIDEEYRNLSEEYNCTYISTYQLFKSNPDYLPNPRTIYPSIDAYKEIYKLIKNICETK